MYCCHSDLTSLYPGQTPGIGLHLHQLGVDRLLGPLQDPNQVPGVPRVTGGEEGVGGAGVLGPSRATDAVNVVFRAVGEVEVDHVLDVGYICKERATRKETMVRVSLWFGYSTLT